MSTYSPIKTKLTPFVFALGLGVTLPVMANSSALVYQFNLVEQPLVYTLNSLAEKADMNLIADAKLLVGLLAPAINGEFNVLKALELTLANSQLSAHIVNNNIVIKANSAARMPIVPARQNDKNARSGAAKNDIEVITVTGNKLQMHRSEIERSSGLSNSDIFSTFSGIEANNIRNEAGALDIGIRGVHGEGRVPIFIDGSLQSTHTNRGYMGASDRSYIDSDLISTIDIEKGSSTKASPYSSGAIGGTVNIRTLSVHDILKSNDKFGASVKLKTHNNNKTPKVPDSFGLQSYYEVKNGIDTFDFNGGGASLAGAYKDKKLQAIVAYSKKEVGNYFAGKNGFEDFVEVKEYIRWVPSKSDPTQYEQMPDVVLIPPPVNKNGEVVNTSFESDSYLAKFAYDFTHEHSLEVNTRLHEQVAGEMLASYWYKHRAGDMKFWKEVDENGVEQRLSEEIPVGVETMPQWEPGTSKVKSASVLYHYLPNNNLYVDLTVNLWRTSAKQQQYNALGSNLGQNAGQYFHRYSNTRLGASALNASYMSIANMPIVLTYGLSWQEEKLAPHKDWLNNFKKDWLPDNHNYKATSRHGKQVKRAVFTNAQIDLAPLELTLNINHHDSKNDDYQTGETLTFDAQTDATLQAQVNVFDNTHVRIKFSNAYRMPNLYESTVSNEVFSYSPDYPIKAENTRSYDIGIESELSDVVFIGDRLVLSAEYFYTNIKDMLATGFLPSKEPDAPSWKQTYSFTNYDTFELPGTEVGFNYHSDWLYGKFSYTKYSKVEMCSNLIANAEGVDKCNDTGFSGSLTPLRIPADKNYIATLGTSLLNDSLDLGFTYKKHSEKHHPGGFLAGTAVNTLAHIPSGYQLDFYLAYEISDNMKGNLSVTNLTDQYKVSTGSIVAMPEPGQTITISLEAKL